MKKLLFLLLLLSTVVGAYPQQAPNKLARNREVALFHLNQNGAIVPPSTWWPTQNINVGSYLNFDIIPKTMQKTMAGEEGDYFALSNIGITADARVTNLVSAHVGVAYFKTNKGQGDRYGSTGLRLDDGYFTVANFGAAPLFAQGGMFYLPFGENQRFGIEPSLVQALTIARAAGVQGGIVGWHGVTATVYAAQGQLKNGGNKLQGAMNYGAALRYIYKAPCSFILKAGVSYIYNILNVNALAEDPNKTADNEYTYRHPVGGVAANLRLRYRWIVLLGRYVTALKNSKDLVNRYQSLQNGYDNPLYGAKPSAWDAGLAIIFKVYGYRTHINFVYSRSYNCGGISIFNTSNYHVFPLARYLLGYTVDWNRNIFTTFEWGHNWLYKKGSGDAGRQGDNATLRFGLKLQ